MLPGLILPSLDLSRGGIYRCQLAILIAAQAKFLPSKRTEVGLFVLESPHLNGTQWLLFSNETMYEWDWS